ncbi:hypothetical protein L21SP5_00715 [Salinivirga cyanobacteriivorans]|uniref:Uncharacterized protein n=1 Tax=Salinivirga cyanobacteriivorans TaxID=1307839 RepID=A0A0S2HWE6_9BACT|nr:hypothetical protein L21SP5_00715 [Salinivirga cyanobacteriivorans]
MKIFDIILFVTLISIAVGQFAFDLIGIYGMLVLIGIALVGLMPTRMIFSRNSFFRHILQRIAGKAQRQ